MIECLRARESFIHTIGIVYLLSVYGYYLQENDCVLCSVCLSVFLPVCLIVIRYSKTY